MSTENQTHRGRQGSEGIFAATILISAALVFSVQPIIGKLMLPLLGGGPSIWNTSLAFFQVMLLFGYGYAHLLQKVRSLKVQAGIHLLTLCLAAFVLPLQVREWFGPPNAEMPVRWLLGALLGSVGAPFAILSATAPLVQAWFVRTVQIDGGPEPYALYAASNVGSLAALIAYPFLIEPLAPLHGQTVWWSVGYCALVLLFAFLAFRVFTSPDRAAERITVSGAAPSSKDRLLWVALAAIPSSLMLGVTSYVTTDFGSAPFLWIIPLALYLLTFIFAFATRQILSRDGVLTFQAAALIVCIASSYSVTNHFVVALHFACFFLTALVCHQALFDRRPEPAYLTEFYLWLAFGGVVGGAFNAFLAPVIFDDVLEYPIALVAACLVRPWGKGPISTRNWVVLVVGMAAASAFVVSKQVSIDIGNGHTGILQNLDPQILENLWRLWICIAFVSAFLLQRRALLYFLVALSLVVSGQIEVASSRGESRWRSFFGVTKEQHRYAPELGGDVNVIVHGTTLHGAQAKDKRFSCMPLTYYAPQPPIGQVFTTFRNSRSALRIGAIGLGAGAVSTYVRPTDHLTFFEIDPLVIKIASDPKHFTYISNCAKGPVDFVVGDARLTLADQPKGVFDILLVDAFSSNSVPVHLLTVEAVRGYLSHIKSDGVVVLHLSNRSLDLMGPAMAVAQGAGGVSRFQIHKPVGSGESYVDDPSDVLVIAKSSAALDAFSKDPRWKVSNPNLTKPWTDDYTNLLGAMMSKVTQQAEGS